jgi:hypothetical protein
VRKIKKIIGKSGPPGSRKQALRGPWEAKDRRKVGEIVGNDVTRENIIQMIAGG